ncbi:DUF2975 domain-containing protein [Chryseobacterium tongliaoense]|uniref:DUF2975 domain-containing protein n=1 Tax=Chryseobacterium tongliaoense TaxID=3240933 RepID=UPI003513E357
MKLFGQKSLSTAISWLLLLLFVIIAFHTVYQLVGFTVCYYNLKTGSHLFPETFYVGDSIEWGGKIVQEKLYFRFKYPFSDQQMLTGIFSLNTFLNHLFQNVFFCLFFFFAYKIFNGMSKEILFNRDVIKWLRKFSWTNILYMPVYIIICLFVFNLGLDGMMLTTCLFLLFLGIMVYFIMEFFKKGLELQNQADLTI